MKKILFTVLAAAALVGCTKENSGVTYADNEILASATTLSVDAITKAPVDGYGNGFLARVPISQTDGDYATEYGTAAFMKFTDATNAVGFVSSDGSTSAAKFYPANGSVYLCGLFPATTWTMNGTKASFTFNGSQDVMAAPQVTSTKADAPDSYKILAFKHLLTQITVKFNAETEEDAKAWGNITGLELLSAENGEVKLANQATVTLKDGTAEFSGTTGTGFYAVTGGTTYSDIEYSSTAIPVDNATAVAYTMCAPVKADGNTGAEYKLKITSASNATETVDINLKQSGNSADFVDSTAGYSFNIELTFKATEIKAIATITPWKDGGTTTVTVGE